ncbi:TPA: hypothetical protein VD674_001368 [Streptococcus pyogenes]|nr:hypothetical protein [Streptococcus pyogenes]
MTYELCLEYGTYPLSRVYAYWGEDQNPPTFIQEDRLLCHKLETMNHLFHYVGFNMPEKRAQIRILYQEVATILKSKYKDYPIKIETFLL